VGRINWDAEYPAVAVVATNIKQTVYVYVLYYQVQITFLPVLTSADLEIYYLLGSQPWFDRYISIRSLTNR
jgi:hypothetical protein